MVEMTQDRPNVLLITTDQHHFTAMGLNNPKIKTPNLDKLASQGTVFNRTYCPNPTCTPTRCTLITGMYPSQHGAWSLGTKLLESVPTIGEELQKAGYKTSLIGKAHFEPLKSAEGYKSLESYPIMQDAEFWKNFNGPYYGFEYIELARNHTDESHVGQHYALWMEENGLENWRDYFLKPTGNKSYLDKKKNGSLWKIPEKYHYNVWIAERINAKLTEYKENNNNFFAWASFLDPHRPRIAPEPWDTMYDPEKMEVPERNIEEHKKNPPHFRYAQVERSDSKLKNIWYWFKAAFKARKFLYYMKDFKKHGVSTHGLHGMHPHPYDKETLKKEIAAYYGMTSLIDKYVGKILEHLDDLGLTENTIIIFTTDHGDFFGQHGFYTKGPYLYEDLLKIPFIVKYPKSIPAGKVSEALLSLVDVPITLLKMLDLPVPNYMTGEDQSEVWNGKKNSVRDHILCEMHHSPEIVHLKTYVNENYKITVYNNEKYGELFDLSQDPEEHNNLWDEPNYQDLKQKLLFEFIQAELYKDFKFN